MNPIIVSCNESSDSLIKIIMQISDNTLNQLFFGLLKAILKTLLHNNFHVGTACYQSICVFNVYTV